jgi:hypothetical protein
MISVFPFLSHPTYYQAHHTYHEHTYPHILHPIIPSIFSLSSSLPPLNYLPYLYVKYIHSARILKNMLIDHCQVTDGEICH